MPVIERIRNVNDKVERMQKMWVCKAFRKPKYKIVVWEDGYGKAVKIEEEKVEAYLADQFDVQREMVDETYPIQGLSNRRNHDDDDI